MRGPGIRPATADDLSALPEVEAAADRLLEAALGCVLPAAESPAPGTAVLYLVAGTPPVGFARLDEVDGHAHLEQLSVHPDFAGRGLGRSLVEAALDAARRRGYESMTLCTFAAVPFNAPFYASCGFHVVAEPGGALAGLRYHEAQLGLDNLGPRVAMRIRL